MVRRRYKQQTRWNIWGSMIVTFYTLAFFFYMWVRITKTLDLGQYLGYGIFVLIVEIMGATSTISYGINLIWSPVNPPLAEDPANPGLPKVGFQCCLHSWVTAADHGSLQCHSVSLIRKHGSLVIPA